MLLVRARQKGRYVNQGNQWNVKAVAETDKSCYLVRGMIIQGTAHTVRLICHDSHYFSIHTAPAHHRIHGKLLLYLEETAIVHDTVDDLFDIISMAGIIRYNIHDFFCLVLHGSFHPAALRLAEYFSHMGQEPLPLRSVDNRRLLLPVAGQIGK